MRANRRIRNLTRHLGDTSTSASAAAAVGVAGPADTVTAVTGCTSGLGLNLCREFARRGFKVAGCGRRQELIDALNAEYGGAGHRFYVADSSSADSLKGWSEAVLSDFGRVDVLVNNAGLGGAGKLPWKMDDARFDQVIDTNVKGVFYGCKYFIQAMLDDLVEHPERGMIKRVINISSGVGHSTSPVVADYSASKWGVEAFSKSTAQAFHLLRDGKKTSDAVKAACDSILCVPLAPGVVGTELNTAPGIPSAEEWCKPAVDFILSIPVSESGSSLTVPGFYSEDYMGTWVIPDGLKLPSQWLPPR